MCLYLCPTPQVVWLKESPEGNVDTSDMELKLQVSSQWSRSFAHIHTQTLTAALQWAWPSADWVTECSFQHYWSSDRHCLTLCSPAQVWSPLSLGLCLRCPLHQDGHEPSGCQVSSPLSLSLSHTHTHSLSLSLTLFLSLSLPPPLSLLQ